MTRWTTLAVLLMTTGAAFGQKKGELKPIEAAAVNLGRPVDFERDVYPILDRNCIACHNLAIDEGKLSLEDVESILKGGKRGPAVVAKQPDKSWLFKFASHTQKPVMPPLPNQVEASTLTPRELGILKQWIIEGASAGMGSAGAVVQWSPLPSEIQSVYGLAISPWGDTIAAGRTNRLFVYDAATGAEVARLIDPNLAALQRDGKPVYSEGVAHRDFVHAIAFSPDGRYIASAGYRVVKLWERVGRTKLAEANAGGAVTATALSADGKWAAIGTDKNVVHIVGTADGKTARTLSGHAGAVTGLAFSPKGDRLVSGSKDKSLRVWNTADGKEIAKLDIPAESNDLCTNLDGTQMISADADNVIRVWAVPTEAPAPAAEGEAAPEPPKPIREIRGHGGPVTAVKLVMPAGQQFVSGSKDGTLRVWNAGNGGAVRSVNHGSPVNAIAVSADGQKFVTVADKGTAKIWNAANGQQIAETKPRPERSRNVLALVEDQTVAKQRVALSDAALKAAEKNLKDRQDALKKATDAKPAADKAVTDAEKKVADAQKKVDEAKQKLAAKPDDNGLKNNVQKAEAEAQKVRDELTKAKTGQEAAMRAIDLSQKSVKTAETTLAESKKTKETAEAVQKKVDADVETAKKAEAEKALPLVAVAFDSAGRVRTGAADGTILSWTAAGVFAEPIGKLDGAVAALATDASGRLLTASASGKVTLSSGESSWALVATLGGKADAPLDVTESPSPSRILCVDFSPDGKLLVAGGGDPSRSGELTFWDVEKRAVVRTLEDAHSDAVFDVQFSRNGTHVVSGSADKFVKLFEVASGKMVRSYEGHTHHVLGVAITADGATIASGSADMSIKIWNRETGEQKRTVKNYTKEVTSLDFIGVGENMVSCGGDQTVRLHRASNGQNYRTLSGNADYVYNAVAARDEGVIAAAGADGVIRVWDKNGQLKQSIAPPKPPATGEAAQTAAK